VIEIVKNNQGVFCCFACGEDWTYGHRSVAAVAAMLAEKKPARIKCAKCGQEYPFTVTDKEGKKDD